jgi:glycosyltransferase involved in cell wall biosynthesis
LFEGSIVIVVMTRSWYDELSLAIIRLLGGRMIVVAHDPTLKQPLSLARRFSRSVLWRVASVLVAHSKELTKQAATVAKRSAEVVPHLPFLEYPSWAREVQPQMRQRGAKKRILVLGWIRSDKGLDRLPSIFRCLSPAVRNGMSVAFAGHGELRDTVTALSEVVEVVRPPWNRRLTDEEIACELLAADICIAPYKLVTASGSVVMALCCEMPVLAYDAGSLRDVVTDEGLVPLGDESQFARRLSGFVHEPASTRRYPLDVWKSLSIEAWLTAIDHAA